MVIHMKLHDSAESPLVRTKFYVSPFREVLWALHVLAHPGHHGVFLRWSLRVRSRISSSLLERIDKLGPFYLLGLASREELGGDVRRFDDEWQQFMAQPLDAWMKSYEDFRHRWVEEFDLRMARHSEWEDWALMQSPDWWKTPALSPMEMRDEMGDVMALFWNQEFAQVWAEIVGDLEQDIRVGQKGLIRESPSVAWQQLSPRIRLQRVDGEIQVLVPWKTDITLTPLASVSLFPSIFCWPHLWLDGNLQGINVSYQSRAIIRWASPVPVPNTLGARLEVISEPTRLLILRHLFGTMGTINSIARILRLAPSTISRHLTLLHASGLVDRITMGHYVLYQVNRDNFWAIGREVQTVERPPMPTFLGWG